MTEHEVAEAKRLLSSFKHFNGGQGLVIDKSLAEVFKKHGIDGPYTISKPLPMMGEEKDNG